MPTNPNVWGEFFKGTGNSYNQFINYLKNTDDLSKLKYVFNKDKLGTTNLKDAFKGLFESKANDLLKPQELGGIGIDKIKQLFGSNIDSADDFINIIKDTKSSIYNFIKNK